MGNIPLCVSKRDGIIFAASPEDLSLTSFRPVECSMEDLSGRVLEREEAGVGEEEKEEEGKVAGGEDVLLGLEMHQGSVSV